uniref:Integrase, catalytic region, zinc finger, CCHC-type, peptidase aspartic, catalytic n=1 Tax=Tanacetum cinerariifolium TaxID=118510 RepID=A0A699GP81_TANCI|nr:hypothetical protein [Tanacetum cinerariifolium]
MSNTNNNMQTQTSSAFHNAIMEAGGKDHPPMLASGYYVQWKSQIKRYIDTKPNHELIHFCLNNPPYQYKFKATYTDETLATPSNDVDACPNAMEMWKAIERLKQEPEVFADDEASSKENKIDKLMALILIPFKKIYKPTNNNLRTSSNTRNTNVDNTPRTNIRTRYDRQTRKYDSQRAGNVVRARENVEQVYWRDDTDNKLEDQELEAYYMYMAKIQDVIQDADNSKPIFDIEPLSKVHNSDDDNNVFVNERQCVYTSLDQYLDMSCDYLEALEKCQCLERVILTTSGSKPQLKSTQLEDRFMHYNSQVKTKEVEDHRRNFKFSKNKTSVTACNDSLNAKTSNVNFVCVTYGKYVLNDNHDLCVLHYINGVNSRTKKQIVVPISTREPKRTVNQFVATPYRKTVASESTIQKPRYQLRKLYEHVSKTCGWWYPKLTPP